MAHVNREKLKQDIGSAIHGEVGDMDDITLIKLWTAICKKPN